MNVNSSVADIAQGPQLGRLVLVPRYLALPISFKVRQYVLLAQVRSFIYQIAHVRLAPLSLVVLILLHSLEPEHGILLGHHGRVHRHVLVVQSGTAVAQDYLWNHHQALGMVLMYFV